MKSLHLYFILCLFSLSSIAQQSVGIGNPSPNASAVLDITSTTKGILVPRYTTANRVGLAAPAKGLIVYDSTTNSLWAFNGSTWAETGNAWNLKGNTGTSSATNFLGTTDNQPLQLKLNNKTAGILNPNGNFLFGMGVGYNMDPGGYRNVVIGDSSFSNATSNAYENIAIGYKTMETVDGNRNVAIGYQSNLYATTGDYNIGLGFRTLFYGGSASYNIAIGYQAGYGATLIPAPTGDENIAIGLAALRSFSSGAHNIGIGVYSLYNVASGLSNVALGTQTSVTNSVGNRTIGIGDSALYLNTVSNTIGIGASALKNNTDGLANTALGYKSLYNNTTGDSNTVVGYNAGLTISTGNLNTILGAEADVTNAAIINSTALGYGATVNTSNVMSFGNENVVRWCFGRATGPAGRALVVGTTTSNGDGAYLTNGGVWTNASDVNLKDDITRVQTDDLLNKIMQLRIQHWRYKNTEEYHIGPMAQDFHKLFGVGVDDKSISTIDPSGIALAAIQELKKQNDLQQQQIDLLKNEIQLLKEKK